MYKTLGIKWLHEAFCPALAFVSADSDEARNPQRFIHVIVRQHAKSQRTFKHIWFLPTRKAQTKNQKSLNFANARQKQSKKLKDRNKINRCLNRLLKT